MRHLIFIGFVSILFNSCQVFDKEEDIPAFIHIDSIFVDYNGVGNEGAITAKVTDAWVFLNDNNMGCWELPATIPLYTSSTQSLKIIGGIKINGIDEFRAQYPFWDLYEVSNFDFDPGVTKSVNPVIEYFEETNFAWKESFETFELTFDSIIGSETSIKVTSDPAYVIEGNNSALISLSDSVSYFKGATKESFQLPTASVPVYLEIDYKSDMDFVVFLISNLSTGSIETSVVGVSGKTDENGDPVANKIYVDLAFDVSTFYQAEDYRVGISTALSSKQDSGKLVIDNLKLIHQ